MKYLIFTIILLAIAFIGISTTAIDFQNLFEGESANALIVILASLCVIVLMAILLVSRRISKKQG